MDDDAKFPDVQIVEVIPAPRFSVDGAICRHTNDPHIVECAFYADVPPLYDGEPWEKHIVVRLRIPITIMSPQWRLRMETEEGKLT